MNDTIISNELEIAYDDLLKKTRLVNNKCKKINEDYRSKIERIKKRKRIFIIITAIIMIIGIILMTILLGNLLQKRHDYEVQILKNGQDVTCYLTPTGDCYHKRTCGYLRRSKIETTMYKAEMEGYSPCSNCWNYPSAIYVTETKTEYEKRYVLGFIISICAFLFLFILIFICLNKRIKTKIKNEDSIFKMKKGKLLSNVKKVLGEKKDFYEKAKKLSGVPADVDYIDRLPTTKDDRFKVYVSCYGKCYHKSKHCHDNNFSTEISIFSAIHSYNPCYFCAKRFEIPDWHNKYIELYNLYNSVIGICE